MPIEIRSEVRREEAKTKSKERERIDSPVM